MTDVKSQYDKEQELLKLSEKDIQLQVDTACAQQGVRLLPSVPNKPAEPPYDKDLTVYQVAGYTFTDEEDARTVAKAINATKSQVSLEYLTGSYDWSMPKWAKGDPDNAADVTTTTCFTAETADRVREDWTLYKALKSEYDDAKKVFDEVKDERDNIEESIRGPIREAAKNERRRHQLASEFRRYEEIAEFDDSIAYKFIHDAYPDVAELFEGVTGLVNYTRGLEISAQED